MRKQIYILAALLTVSLCGRYRAQAIETGFVWALRANFNGTATLPSINKSDLEKIAAEFMKGAVGYTMDGEAELGYLFDSTRFFKMESNKVFGGLSVFGTIGVGSGFSGQSAGATYSGVTATMYINVNYAPVITFGVGSKAYLLRDRLALGLWLGTKMIVDVSPEYLAYMDDTTIMAAPEIGEIIVTPFMMKNMNPFSFSTKFLIEYQQPINQRLAVLLGGYLRFNLWSPKYITMPPSLMSLMNDQLKKDGKPEFSAETPLPSYFLNSLDFGVSLGVQFRV
ncbi:MAG: hypothetical protein IJ191_05200 [Treponema sp.]|nr:hypothetical protein [Treponema sp.]